MTAKVMNFNSVFAMALFLLLAAVPAQAEKCKLSPLQRARLKSALSPALAGVGRQIWGEPTSSDLKLFLTFEKSTRNLGTLESRIVCSEPTETQVKSAESIANRLGIGPVEMRKMVDYLANRYPKDLIRHRTELRIGRILELLEEFAASGQKDLVSYVVQVEAFREEFENILQPNHIFWPIGILPSDMVVNKASEQKGKYLAQAQEEVIEQARHSMTLLGAGVDVPSMTVHNYYSVTLINASIADYALLHALKMSPRRAALEVAVELQSSGHGYLAKASHELMRRYGGIGSCEAAF